MRLNRVFGALIASALASLTMAGSAFARPNACNNEDTAPRIVSGTIKSPDTMEVGTPLNWNPANGRLARSGLQYVSFNSMRMEIVTDRCAAINSVRLGARELSFGHDTPSGFWFSASPSVQQPADPALVAHSLNVFFQNPADGTTHYLTVTVGRTGGTGTAIYSFRLVHVLAVNSQNVHGSIGVSAAEFHNMVAKGVRAEFGARLEREAGPITVFYDPASLQTAITPGGLSFSYRLTTSDSCISTVNISGLFALSATPAGGFEIKWKNNSPRASPILGTACGLVVTLEGPLSAVIDKIMRDAIEDEIDSAKASLNELLQSSIEDGGANVDQLRTYLHGTTTRAGELLVHVIIPARSVTVQTPYVSLAEDVPGIGVARREVVLLTATGLGMNDIAFGAVPQTTLSSGPNGVPRTGTVSWPNPRVVARAAPWPVANAPAGLLLASARMSAGGVGAVTGTGGPPPVHKYKPGCTVTAPAGPTVAMGSRRDAEIRLGVNDSPADAQRLRAIGARGYTARLYFLAGLNWANAIPRCPKVSGGGLGVSPR